MIYQENLSSRWENGIHNLQPVFKVSFSKKVLRQQEIKQSKSIYPFHLFLHLNAKSVTGFFGKACLLSNIESGADLNHPEPFIFKANPNITSIILGSPVHFSLSLWVKTLTDLHTLQFSPLLLDVLCPWKLPLIFSKEPRLGGRSAPWRHLLFHSLHLNVVQPWQFVRCHKQMLLERWEEFTWEPTES